MASITQRITNFEIFLSLGKIQQLYGPSQENNTNIFSIPARYNSYMILKNIIHKCEMSHNDIIMLKCSITNNKDNENT